MPHTTPNQEMFAAFLEADLSGPIQMLNLLKFRDVAAYADQKPSNLSGREAYAKYAQATAPLFAEAGGQIIWSGRPAFMLIGPSDHWDAGFIAAYPDKVSFLEMIQSADYQTALPHRMAALSDSRLLAIQPDETSLFG